MLNLLLATWGGRLWGLGATNIGSQIKKSHNSPPALKPAFPSLWLFGHFFRKRDRCNYGRCQQPDYHHQREVNRYLVIAAQQHFHADKSENGRYAELEEMELVDHTGEKEIKRAQAEYGADIRCVDQKRVSRDCENRGDGVNREYQVG